MINWRQKDGLKVSILRFICIGGFAVILFLIQLIAIYPSYRNDSTIFWSFILFLSLMATCWLPFAGGIVYAVSLSIGLLVVPDTQMLVIAAWGIYAVAADWISRRWFLGATGILLAVSALQLFLTDFPEMEIFEIGIGIFASVSIGLGVFATNRRIVRLQDEVAISEETARSAKEAVSQDIASNLHQTVAKDLVGIIITGDRLLMLSSTDEEKQRLERIQNLARGSLATIRRLIAQGKPNADRTVLDVVDECAVMLTTNDLALDAEVPDGIDMALTERQRQLLFLSLQESATNAMKYAPGNTRVQLLLEMLPLGEVALTITSRLPEDYHGKEVLKGAFGLDYLKFRLKEVGGTLDVGPISQRWMFSARIPAFVSEGELRESRP